MNRHGFRVTFDTNGAAAANGARGPLVVFALPCLCIGGTEVVCVSLATELLKRGYRVDFVFGWEEKGSRLLLPDEARTLMFNVKRTRQFVRPFARYLREEKPDVVVASLWPFTIACLLAHRFANSASKLVVWDHNTLSVQYRGRGFFHRLLLATSIALTYPFAYARIAVSSGVADDLAKLAGIRRESISVIYNPLLRRPLAEAGIAAAEEIWGGWRGPRIITVGQLKAQKNHALLIRAFEKLLRKQDARLLILGEGALFAATRERARSQGVADRVIMPGAVLDPMPYYASADLFVLSSDFEGFGNVIVEALACGLPVVSTDCQSGPSEILENGRYGRLVPVGDDDALAEAMSEALLAEHDREALKRRAEDFTPERLAEQYLRVIFEQTDSADEATAGG